MALNRDQRRALRLLAAAPNGATEPAHGFEHARGLATAEQRATHPGGSDRELALRPEPAPCEVENTRRRRWQ
jgi:hypothetical protein